MSDNANNDNLSRRVLSLEKVYYTSRALVLAAIFLIAILVGHTYFFQIPDEIEEQLKSHINKRTGKNLDTVFGEIEQMRSDVRRLKYSELHIESGTEIAHHDEFSGLREWKGRSGTGGAIDQRVDFDRPFVVAPKVMVALSFLDHVIVPRTNNLRIETTVTKVDRHRFNYSIVTWADTDIWRADLSWIAYGRSHSDASTGDSDENGL